MGRRSINQFTRPIRYALAVAATLAFVLGFLAPAAQAGPDRASRAELARVRIEIERELRARPELHQAKQEWVTLRLESQRLRQLVVQQLSADGTYLAIRADMWRAEDELAALVDYYRNGVVPSEPLNRLATEILQYRLILGKMEQEALQRNHEALQAHEAYMQAARRLMRFDREIEDLIRNDPRFQEALSRLKGRNRR